MKQIKRICTECGEEFLGYPRKKYCPECDAIKKKNSSTTRKYKIKLQKELEGCKAMNLANAVQEAKKQGMSYGKYQAEEYAKTVKIDFPKKEIPYEHRKQQFNEIVAQMEEREKGWENQSTTGME